MNNNREKIIVYSTLFLMLMACSHREVIITQDYVINPNWDELNNTFGVYKMDVKSGCKLNLHNIHPPDLINNLTIDSSQSFIGMVTDNGEPYDCRKVYFNSSNDFLWCELSNLHTQCQNQVIGNLQENEWYQLIGLSRENNSSYFIHIDSTHTLHVFEVPDRIWKNY